MIRGLLIAVTSLLLGPAALAAQPSPAQEGFVRATELPPGQQLPAAPFLIGAYAFMWVALIFYLWTIWRRLDAVEKEMRALDARQGQSGT